MPDTIDITRTYPTLAWDCARIRVTVDPVTLTATIRQADTVRDRPAMHTVAVPPFTAYPGAGRGHAEDMDVASVHAWIEQSAPRWTSAHRTGEHYLRHPHMDATYYGPTRTTVLTPYQGGVIVHVRRATETYDGGQSFRAPAAPTLRDMLALCDLAEELPEYQVDPDVPANLEMPAPYALPFGTRITTARRLAPGDLILAVPDTHNGKPCVRVLDQPAQLYTLARGLGTHPMHLDMDGERGERTEYRVPPTAAFAISHV